MPSAPRKRSVWVAGRSLPPVQLEPGNFFENQFCQLLSTVRSRLRKVSRKTIALHIRVGCRVSGCQQIGASDASSSRRKAQSVVLPPPIGPMITDVGSGALRNASPDRARWRVVHRVEVLVGVEVARQVAQLSSLNERNSSLVMLRCGASAMPATPALRGGPPRFPRPAVFPDPRPGPAPLRQVPRLFLLPMALLPEIRTVCERTPRHLGGTRLRGKATWGRACPKTRGGGGATADFRSWVAEASTP
jgi:hypothetical protein